MDTISINSHITLRDYRKLLLQTMYSKFSMKALTGIGILMLIIFLINIVFSARYEDIGGVFMALALISVMPILGYVQAKKNYTTNQTLSEKIHYDFTQADVVISGESFHSKLAWKNIYQVTETKEFIVIWQSKQVGNFIHKREFNSNNLKEFKELIRSIDGLKSNL